MSPEGQLPPPTVICSPTVRLVELMFKGTERETVDAVEAGAVVGPPVEPLNFDALLLPHAQHARQMVMVTSAQRQYLWSEVICQLWHSPVMRYPRVSVWGKVLAEGGSPATQAQAGPGTLGHGGNP
jgi:hypothetical protein